MKTEEATALMASLANALKEEISTLARREVRRQTAPADKAMARCARDLAALKREVQALEHKLASLGTPQPGPTVPPKTTSDRAPPSRRAASKVSATSTWGHQKVCSYDYGKDEERPSHNTVVIL